MLDRKDSHIQLCLEEAVEFRSQDANGFAQLRFDHDALPEINKSEIDLSVSVFGKKLKAPLIIGSMTGGTEKAEQINKRLALAAQECQIGLALGSQRKMIDHQELKSTYAMKEVARKLPLLIGNLGAVQLNYGVTQKDVQRLIDDVNADAFVFHLNPLQEAIQPEGDVNFKDLLPKLKELIPNLSVPVFFKEVGSGISERTALKLRELPIAGIETAGVGGTSWSKIESLRSKNKIQKNTGELFARWGISTVESIQVCKSIFPNHTIIASGGIRNGIEGAKAIALGANAFAIALPMLKAAEESVEAVVESIEQVIEELRTAMFVTGCQTVKELQVCPLRKVKDFTGTEYL